MSFSPSKNKINKYLHKSILLNSLNGLKQTCTDKSEAENATDRYTVLQVVTVVTVTPKFTLLSQDASVTMIFSTFILLSEFSSDFTW